MIQRIWRQLQQLGLSKDVFISANQAQVAMIRDQIGDAVPIIVEPQRMDTFPAVALTATRLYAEGIDAEEVIVILPIDLYVEHAFFTTLKKLADALIDTKKNIALVGVKPTTPSEEFGYIVPYAHEAKKRQDNVQTVRCFVEKPAADKAQALIEEGALWNCGVFGFTLGYFINLLKKRNIPTRYEQLLDAYPTLPKQSFDYEVLEKEEGIVVLPYNGAWKDLGNWGTLTEEMNASIMGLGILEACSHSTIVNELEIPIVGIGLSDTVIVASPGGILVSDKNKSPIIKKIIKESTERPLFEERRWGKYRVLDYIKFDDGTEVVTKRIKIDAGKNISYQLHYKRCEVWTVIKGDGEFVLNDRIIPVKAGDVLTIPLKAAHGIKANSDMEIIEVQSGTEVNEEDIVRIYMNWHDVEAHCRRIAEKTNGGSGAYDNS